MIFSFEDKKGFQLKKKVIYVYFSMFLEFQPLLLQSTDQQTGNSTSLLREFSSSASSNPFPRSKNPRKIPFRTSPIWIKIVSLRIEQQKKKKNKKARKFYTKNGAVMSRRAKDPPRARERASKFFALIKYVPEKKCHSCHFRRRQTPPHQGNSNRMEILKYYTETKSTVLWALPWKTRKGLLNFC